MSQASSESGDFGDASAEAGGAAGEPCQLRARAPGRVILQVPDLYGNIISYALDVIIEPDDATDACARKL